MASEATEPQDIVQCHETGVVLANAKKWELDVPTEFQWMPGGVTTINAHYNGKPIELTVEAGPITAKAVQASYQDWFRMRPKQAPFGCVEHREEEAALRLPKDVAAFTWKDGDGEQDAGIYCTAVPTELGARNVNGRIHSSWSPSFTTNAEYTKAKEVNGRLVFPKGARGSASNPASVTGVAFSVGSLTNKPAFRNISPVRAKEGEVVEGQDNEEQEETPVEATGTSEGVKKSWEHRKGGEIEHRGGYYNVSLVHSDGRVSSSQIYQNQKGGSNGPAANFVLKQKERGDNGNPQYGEMPVAHAFVHHAGVTHHYDMTKEKHIGELESMAKKVPSVRATEAEPKKDGVDAIYAKLSTVPKEVEEIYARVAEPEDPLQTIYDRIHAEGNTQPAECKSTK